MVAMARTGSGKTAAFLVPMLQRLKTRSTAGARGIVLAPSRELAMQTFKFAKEVRPYTPRRVTVRRALGYRDGWVGHTTAFVS